MPTSHPFQLNEIVEVIFRANPGSMLDVGVGFGKIGFLAREYLELWDGRERYGQWTRRIDGIEAFPEYLTPVHKFIYNEVYVGNANDILPRLDVHYDLITAVDVLEHFDFAGGAQFLTACTKRGRNVLLSTPKDVGDQGDAFGNPYETHRFQWLPKHFKTFKDVFIIDHDVSLIVCFGEDARRIRASLLYSRFIPRLKRCFPVLAKVSRFTKGR